MRPILTLAAIAALLFGVRYYYSPMRTPIPPLSTDVVTLREQIERLDPTERNLIIGYLARQRRRVPSTVMRDDGPFEARNFGQAIAAQRAYLKAEPYQTAGWFLTVAQRDELLAPLRAAVSVELYERRMSSKAELSPLPAEYQSLLSSAERDAPVLVATYRMRNLTPDAIVSVQGSIRVRPAHFDLLAPHTYLNECFFSKEKLGRGGLDIRCYRLDRSLTPEDQAFFDANEEDLHVVWSPRKIEFANGRTLTFDERGIEAVKLFGFYGVNTND